jgi:hypothetical protein
MMGDSFWRKSPDLRAQNAPQYAHGPMNVGLNRTDRLIENLGNLRVASAFDEP